MKTRTFEISWKTRKVTLSDSKIGIGKAMSTAKETAKALFWMKNLGRETFVIVSLNTQECCIGVDELSKGTMDKTALYVAEAFRIALLRGATSLILLHNHPSGNSLPSVSDTEATQFMIKAGKTLQIPCLDHIIIGETYHSFLEHNPELWTDPV